MQLALATDLIPGTHRSLAFTRETLADEVTRQLGACGLSASRSALSQP